MAGSAILQSPKQTGELHTVTVTINNSCNYQCDHCYLQYAGQKTPISPAVRDKIYVTRFKHLAIVGKEPTMHPEIVAEMSEQMASSGRTASIITNGALLHHLTPETLKNLAYIDVSFDGGPDTYARMRKGNFKTIIENVQQADRPVTALHTLYKENLPHIDDMVAVRDYADFKHILFSPYLISKNDGKNNVGAVSVIGDILPTLARSEAFLEEPKAKLLLSKLQLLQEGVSVDRLAQALTANRLTDKTLLFTEDPINKGFIRVNYDGGVITPFQSLHPVNYRNAKHHLTGTQSLEEIARELRN